jgi:hypothetical protein
MSEGRGDPLARRAAELLRQEPANEKGLETVLAALRAEAANGGPARSEGSAAGPAEQQIVRRYAPQDDRVVRLTPLVALAAAALIFVVGLGAGAVLLGRRAKLTSAVASADAVAPRTPARVVEFVFVAPAASRVSLVGEFNGWDAKATPMRVVAGRGTWSVSVPLSEGRHVYAFVVDDSTWVPDPQAPLSPEQWYGERNSVMVVPPATPAAGGPRT